VKRILSGSLEHLSPPALLRLVSATSPSGILEIVTADGSLRLEVNRGRVNMPSKDELVSAGRVLACRRGEFRFSPCEVTHREGEVLSLTTFAEAASAAASNVEVDRLLQEERVEVSRPENRPDIHVLPSEPPMNPLEDLLADLEVEAPTELLAARIGVAIRDPRWWRGSMERDWRRRGWRVRYFSAVEEVDLTAVDLLVVHHQPVGAGGGEDARWFELIARAATADPVVPVIWVGPLTNEENIHRLIQAGVSFLMPVPRGGASEILGRLAGDLGSVIERQLQANIGGGRSTLPSGVTELVGALLSGSDPDQGVSSLLQLAAEHFERGAVLMVEGEVVRCRAGFGYPLDRGQTTLPRGVGLLEHVIHTGEAVMAIDPESDAVAGVADVLGIGGLSAATALIPLGRSGGVAGVLVADRRGRELPELDDLVLLAGRLGGAVVRMSYAHEDDDRRL